MTPTEQIEKVLELSLGKHQEKFSHMVYLLFGKAFELGYDIRIEHCKRCDNCPVGHKISLHKLKLAIDLSLFKNGRFLCDTHDHKPLGEFWESIGGSWGGRFQDGNHYSLSYKGMR
jgi:hypothetical protein